MGEKEEFNPLTFEKKLMQLKDTQESIQGLSSWCLKQKEHHKKIVASWLNVLKRVKVEQRLVLFYLANDVIQYSKRKNYEFVKSWGLNLQKATPLVRDEKVRHKISRIFKIWEQRSVYDEEFLSDLTGLLSAGTKKSSDDDALDFQPQQLVNKIKQCSVLEADTDSKLKNIHENKLDMSDPDVLCSDLKDRSNRDDVEKELNEGILCVESYTTALQREIVAREALLALLTSANQYYSTQRGEVKVVAYAYKNFGARVRALKRKLDELIPNLSSAAPSPPRNDEDVPSPRPDEDIELPQPDNNNDDNDLAYNIDRTFNTSIAEDGSLYNLGLSSFLTSNENPLALFNEVMDNNGINNSNKIEVINNRPAKKPDFDVNDFFKNLVPNDSNINTTAQSDNNSVASGTLSQKSQDALPGLDLLTPDSHPPPPTSFYGTIEIIDDPEPPPYRPEPEIPPLWNNNAWSIPPPATTAHFADTPESPPRVAVTPITPVFTPSEPPPASDVDHRGILPPPPPPPVLPILSHLEDVDHRLLPPPPPPIVPLPTTQQQGYDDIIFNDVDHRNLISLTQQLHQPPPRPVAPPNNLDQDYRVPTMVPPPDIVESVDMDLSEDEDQHAMYQNQTTHRPGFNNKVLVGGNNGKTNFNDQKNANLIQINRNFPNNDNRPHFDTDRRQFDHERSEFDTDRRQFDTDSRPNFDSGFDTDNRPRFNSDRPPPHLNNERLHFDNKSRPHTAPVLPPMTNPFDKMPPALQNYDNKYEEEFNQDTDPFEDDTRSREPDPFDEDLRSRGLIENPNWAPPPMNQRFPRNWGPRANIRPQPFGQFRPRNGPRPPNRWNGPRQRFW